MLELVVEDCGRDHADLEAADAHLDQQTVDLVVGEPVVDTGIVMEPVEEHGLYLGRGSVS